MKNIFIVVLNWNRAKDTLSCLESIKGLNKDNFNLSVVVVDNASADSSQKELKSINIPNSKYFFIRNKKNLGYAGGMNVGMKYSLEKKADYIVLLNNDTRLDTNTISELLITARKEKYAGILCPKIYFEKGFEFHKKRYKESELGKVIWYAGGNLDWNNVYGTNKGVDEVDNRQYDEIEDTDFATGNCIFIKASYLSELGLFDEKYYMYLEDVELCTRFKKNGVRVVYSPNSYMWHKVAQSSGIGSSLNDYFITRNRMLFGLKYAPYRTKLALVRESMKLIKNGRKWQKVAIKDYYKGNLGKGSWK